MLDNIEFWKRFENLLPTRKGGDGLTRKGIEELFLYELETLK